MELESRNLKKRKHLSDCTNIVSGNTHISPMKINGDSISSTDSHLIEPPNPHIFNIRSDVENPRIRTSPSTSPQQLLKSSADSVEVDCVNAGVATVYSRRRAVEKTRDKGKEVMVSVPLSCPPPRRTVSIGDKRVKEERDSLSNTCKNFSLQTRSGAILDGRNFSHGSTSDPDGGKTKAAQWGGTVTIGLLLDKMIILAADGRIVKYRRGTVCLKKYNKIRQIGPYVTFTFAYDLDPLEEIEGRLLVELRRRSELGLEFRVTEAINVIHTWCRHDPDDRNDADFHLLVAGWDVSRAHHERVLVPRIVSITHDGVPSDVTTFHCTGGGAMHAWQIVNNEYLRTMTRDQAIDMCRRAIAHCADFVNSVGGYMRECVITEDRATHGGLQSIDLIRLQMGNVVNDTSIVTQKVVLTDGRI